MKAPLLLSLCSVLAGCAHHGKRIGPSQLECSPPMAVLPNDVELDPLAKAEHELFTNFQGADRAYFVIRPSLECPLRHAEFHFGTLHVLVGQPPWQVIIEGDDAAAWAQNWSVSLEDACGRSSTRHVTVMDGAATPQTEPEVTCVLSASSTPTPK